MLNAIETKIDYFLSFLVKGWNLLEETDLIEAVRRHFCDHSLICARAQYSNVAISGTPCYRRGGFARAFYSSLSVS